MPADLTMEIYLVGGAVRDRLLGLPVYDRDWVVVGATPEQMLAEGFQPVGRDFPVFLHPRTHEEYALARTERKAGRGYQGFQFHTSPGVTLQQDLLRRDLTINAMAENADGRLIDPYGGQRDLEARVLRHVSPAFVEDPLRVLRVARFAARFHHLGFSVAAETLQLMSQLSRGDELAALSAERVWKELERALSERSPLLFFHLLARCGGLDYWFPELHSLFDGQQPPSLAAVERACQLDSDSATRLAVLLSLLPTGAAAATTLLERLKAPKAYAEQALLLIRFGPLQAQFGQLSAEQRLALWEGLDLARRPDRLVPFVQGCLARYPGIDASALAELSAQIETVQPRALVAEGFKGKALGAELRRRRLQAIVELAS